MTNVLEPRHPGKLAGSKWTSRDPTLPYCHWVVIEVSGDQVVLQSVLERTATMRIAWRGLRVRERWIPGWS
jgi:tryptophan-rich hypothetical protein